MRQIFLQKRMKKIVSVVDLQAGIRCINRSGFAEAILHRLE